MGFVVHNMIAELEPLFLSSASPKEKFAQAQRTVVNPDGLASRLGRAADSPEYAVMAAALQDGYDVVAAQQVWGLFNPARSMAATAWQFARYHEANLPAIAQNAWERCAAQQPLAKHVECYLLPGDAANRTFMMHNLGISAFASVVGDSAQIRVAIWPSRHNVKTFPEVVERLYAHVAGAGQSTLGRFITREALAASFHSFGKDETWLGRRMRDLSTWREALRDLAEVCGVKSAAELPVNVYGTRSTLGTLPDFWNQLAPLANDERDYACELIRNAWESTHPGAIAAHLYGDAVVAEHGIEPVGLPPFAGFQVATSRYFNNATNKM
jgi:hypothetical protein